MGARLPADRGILGTSILWFERDWDAGGGILDPSRWRELCLAAVTTHDLPPTAGYLTGAHIALRDRLDLLTRPVEEERAGHEAERTQWIDYLRAMACSGRPTTSRSWRRCIGSSPVRPRD